MSHTVNLDTYFARIGYEGPRAATLEVLQALHRLHPRAIPFENLNPLTRRPVRLDLETVERKLVTEHRGGYCFEQNALFADVLTQLGFTVTPLLGRVLWGRESDASTAAHAHGVAPRHGNEAWIADVGFGSVTLTAPLRLTAGLAQPTELARSVSPMHRATRSISKCRRVTKAGRGSTASICTRSSGSTTKPRTGTPRPRRKRFCEHADRVPRVARSAARAAQRSTERTRGRWPGSSANGN